MNPIREGMKILPGHWHKGAYTDGKGNFCGLGAGLEAIRRNETLNFDTEIRIRFFNLMNEVAQEQYPGAAGFAMVNDDVAESEEDVLRLMDKAAVEWDYLYG